MSITMELCLLKGLLAVLLLQLCRAQDVAPPSPSHEPAPPSLVDMIDAVKAAFEQAVQIAKDKAVQEVFEQVAAEPSPETVVDGTEEGAGGLAAMHAMQERTVATLDSSEQNGDAVSDGVELIQNPVEPVYQPNKLISIQEQEEPVSESHRGAKAPTEELKTEAAESIQELAIESVEESEELEVESFKQDPKTDLGEEESEDQSVADQQDIEPDESPVQVDLPLDSVTDGERQGKEAGEQVEKDEGNEAEKIEQDTLDSLRAGETEVGDKNEEVKDVIGAVDREAKVQKKKMPKQHAGEEQDAVKDASPEDAVQVQDDQDQDKQWASVGEAVVETETAKENVERETGEAGGEAEEEEQTVLTGKTTMVQKSSQEAVEVTADAERAGAVEDVNEPLEPQEPVIAESNSMDDVTQETNDMNDIVTPRDSLLGLVEANREAPTPGNVALPPSPTQGLELGNADELVEEPADNTQSTSPGQEVWKIGAIAAAFFLILQTVITVVYILKCKRKPNSRAGTAKGCEEGNGRVGNNMAHTETLIAAENQTTLDDLPECSEDQQEAIAMTALPTDSGNKLSEGPLSC